MPPTAAERCCRTAIDTKKQRKRIALPLLGISDGYKPEGLGQRAQLVGQTYDGTLPGPGYTREVQRPHVGADNVPLNAVQPEMDRGVFERPVGVPEPVQRVIGVLVVPIVEVEVVQQRSAQQAPLIDPAGQPPGDAERQRRHAQTVGVGGGMAVLDKLPHGLHQLVALEVGNHAVELRDLVPVQQFTNQKTHGNHILSEKRPSSIAAGSTGPWPERPL